MERWYLLGISVIKNKLYPYYTIQLQNEATFVLPIVCYNTKVHNKLLQILKSENPIKIELQPTSNDIVKFTSSCLVTPLLQIDVDFKLNCDLNLTIEMEKESREAEIGNLKEEQYRIVYRYR